MKDIKHILDLMHKNEMRKNREDIRLHAFLQWLRKDLIGDTSGVTDAKFKPEERYIPGPE